MVLPFFIWFWVWFCYESFRDNTDEDIVNDLVKTDIHSR